MKKKVVAGLVAITALSMIVGGCGVNSHVGNKDENTSSTESSNVSSSDEEEDSKNESDKVALPEKVEGDAICEESISSDDAVSNENASDNVIVPDGFEVNYECEYFTDYDKGDITVRINHGDYDEEVNQFLKGNPDYLDAATLSDAGTYKMGDREVQAIKSDGHIDDMDTGYVKYYFVGDGVNASIYNRVNDELTVDDAEELVSEFYE